MSSDSAGPLVAAAVIGSAALYVASAVYRRNRLHFVLPPGCMRGRTCIVTGANSGIGRVVAQEVSEAGATTVLACRDVQKAERVASSIRTQTKGAQVSVIPLDLECPSSVAAFARQFEKHHSQVDLLVLNAGAMHASYAAVDGIERTFAANYLGHCALTQRMLPLLRAASTASGERARVISVASRLERRAPPLLCEGNLALAPLMHAAGYTLGRAYAVSKVCQISWALELQRRHPDVLISVAVTPGMVDTNLSRFLPWWKRVLATPIKPLLLRSPAKGAETVLYAAAAPAAKVCGRYLGDCAEVEPSCQASDPRLAALLWEETARMAASGKAQ